MHRKKVKRHVRHHLHVHSSHRDDLNEAAMTVGCWERLGRSGRVKTGPAGRTKTKVKGSMVEVKNKEER
jgi:hypothetical protein